MLWSWIAFFGHNLLFAKVGYVNEKKYPTITKMLQAYINFIKLRFDQYQRDEREPEVKNTFNYIDYIRMNHFDAENGMVLFEKFPYFCELPESDKSALFKRFREPFLLFERIYDTLNIVGSKLDDKYIMLQNGDCFNFATLNQAFMPREMSNVFKIIFSSWAAFLPVIRKMNLEIIEAVYIFCCLLWNTWYKKPHQQLLKLNVIKESKTNMYSTK